MTREEELIKRYFDAFNRHDIGGVMACYHDEPVLVAPNGNRCEGRAAVRKSYEREFAMFPDGHCDCGPVLETLARASPSRSLPERAKATDEWKRSGRK